MLLQTDLGYRRNCWNLSYELMSWFSKRFFTAEPIRFIKWRGQLIWQANLLEGRAILDQDPMHLECIRR